MAESRLTNNSEETSFNKLLETRCYYTIPPFQREYKWKPQNLEQLLADVTNVIEEQEEAHFMGALILDQLSSSPSAPSIYEVIDGQQRLTTVYLLISAIVRVFLKEKRSEKAAEIALNYLFTRESTNQLRSRLTPSMPDQGDLNMVLDDLWNSGLSEALATYVLVKLPTNEVNQGRVKKNYEFFRADLQKKFRSEGEESVVAFLQAALDRLTVVQIVVKDPTSGPKIFDSLNSKQEPMTTGDLVRNEIFNKIARQNPELAQTLDKQLWQPFYMSFKRDGQDTFEGFFFPFGLIKNSQFKKSEVYPGLRKMWHEMAPTEVIQELEEYKYEYQDLVFGEQKGGYSQEVNKRVLRHNRMGLIKAGLPFLMSVLHASRTGQINDLQAKGMLDATESFLVRRALCSLEPTGLHAVFKKLWKDLDGTYSGDAVAAVLSDAKTVSKPSDEEVVVSFSKPFYGKSIAKYFLYEYEVSLAGDLSNTSFDDLWIEHILPDSYHQKNWPSFSLEEHEKLRHFAGNLLPLSESMNRDLGQGSLQIKSKIYGDDSGYKSARVFASTFSEWNPELLLIRNRELASWAVKRWPEK